MRAAQSEISAITNKVIETQGATTTDLRGRTFNSRSTANESRRAGMAPSYKRRRGTAEIELLLSIFVLIVLLNGAVYLRKLGSARLSGLQNADFKAFQDATQTAAPQYADNAADTPIDGFTSVRPGFPNRVHAPQNTSQVSFTFSSQSNLQNGSTVQANLVANAVLPAPSWTYPAYPDTSDEGATEQWFQNYVEESHQELIAPLGLAPPWTP